MDDQNGPDSELVVVACQAIEQGDMCGMPSVPGYAQCERHLKVTKKKVLRDRVREVQEQVYVLVEAQVEEAVHKIVQIMHDDEARIETKLKAATTILQLAGADLTAASAHAENREARQRKQLEGLISPDDEKLLIIVQQVNPERAELMRTRAIEAASRELGADAGT